MNETTLSALRPGQTGVVCGFSLEGDMTRRLRDLGLIPGTPVACLGLAPLGDPCAYQMRGTVIALRRQDSRRVQVTL